MASSVCHLLDNHVDFVTHRFKARGRASVLCARIFTYLLRILNLRECAPSYSTSPRATDWHGHLAFLRYSKWTKQVLMHSKIIAVKFRTRDTPQEAALYVVCLATPCAARPRVSLPPVYPILQAPIVATIQVNIDESLLKQNEERIL
jgi:hypothetical protein